MDIQTYHRTLKHVTFDPSSVELPVPPGLLEDIKTVEAAIAAGRVKRADVERIVKFMAKYGPFLAERREHAVRRERLAWQARYRY